MRTKKFQKLFFDLSYYANYRNCQDASPPLSQFKYKILLVAECRHKAQHKLRNHQPNQITFSANRFITVA